MRRVSQKRAALNRQVAQWREDFRHRVGRCEFCLQYASPEVLDIHELVAGSSRAKALDKEYAVLALHRACHSIIEMLTIPQQLAYLYRARPNEFDLPALWKLTGRRWPELEHVLSYWEKIQ